MSIQMDNKFTSMHAEVMQQNFKINKWSLKFFNAQLKTVYGQIKALSTRFPDKEHEVFQLNLLTMPRLQLLSPLSYIS